jgi:hypothetical protein
MNFIKFTPSDSYPFSFFADFDGRSYTVHIEWNLGAGRYYVRIVNNNGHRIMNKPLIESPLKYDISLTQGYFKTRLIYRADYNRFEITG